MFVAIFMIGKIISSATISLKKFQKKMVENLVEKMFGAKSFPRKEFG